MRYMVQPQPFVGQHSWVIHSIIQRVVSEVLSGIRLVLSGIARVSRPSAKDCVDQRFGSRLAAAAGLVLADLANSFSRLPARSLRLEI